MENNPNLSETNIKEEATKNLKTATTTEKKKLLQLDLIKEPSIIAFEMLQGARKIQVLDAKSAIRHLRDSHRQINNLTRVVNYLLRENRKLKAELKTVELKTGHAINNIEAKTDSLIKETTTQSNDTISKNMEIENKNNDIENKMAELQDQISQLRTTIDNLSRDIVNS